MIFLTTIFAMVINIKDGSVQNDTFIIIIYRRYFVLDNDSTISSTDVRNLRQF